MLASGLSTVCLRLCSGSEINISDHSVINQLMERDIVRCVDAAIRPKLCPPLAFRNQTGRNHARKAPFTLVLIALARYAFAAADLKYRSFDRVIGRIGLSKQRLLAGSSAHDPGEVAAGFVAADRLITARGRCLARSIAMARTMSACGIAPTLVLGVKLRPFEAHCWVQHHDVLISDDPGTVAPFTPILIV